MIADLEETLTQKLELVLHRAGRDGELAWVEVNAVMDIVERWEILADNHFWTIYEALAPRPGEASMPFPKDPPLTCKARK